MSRLHEIVGGALKTKKLEHFEKLRFMSFNRTILVTNSDGLHCEKSCWITFRRRLMPAFPFNSWNRSPPSHTVLPIFIAPHSPEEWTKFLRSILFATEWYLNWNFHLFGWRNDYRTTTFSSENSPMFWLDWYFLQLPWGSLYFLLKKVFVGWIQRNLFRCQDIYPFFKHCSTFCSMISVCSFKRLNNIF